MEATPRIIVVDDESKICRNVEKILRKNNFDVTCATSAEEAMTKMAAESYSLLISDILMPGTSGLELLKLVKEQWPLTKAVMMTAYASTDTAVKAIRLGALDYIPKPFTPNELRETVERALAGQVEEVMATEEEKAVIDADIPFDPDEVAKQTGVDYEKRLGRSDMPMADAPSPETLVNFCAVGEMVCDIYKKLGNTCKAGVKTEKCPQKQKRKKKGKGKGFDAKTLIGIDHPFNYEEVVAVTGPEYVRNMGREGVMFLSYEELKASVPRLMQTEARKASIDEDAPFNAKEVAKYTDNDYEKKLGRSGIPAVDVPSPETLVNYCAVGEMVCDIHKKLGNTCKAGLKTAACPQKKKGKKGKAAQRVDMGKFVGVDMPFDYEEIVAATGSEYAMNLQPDGFAVTPYETLRENVSKMMTAQTQYPDEPAHKNILVIDDEVAVNNNIRKILKKKGYHVDQAVTKAEALERITAQSYKLVLLDLRIPGVKGLELLEAVREQRPEAKVIIITGYASIDTAVEGARLGAIDYVQKPFTPNEIRTAAERAFRLAA